MIPDQLLEQFLKAKWHQLTNIFIHVKGFHVLKGDFSILVKLDQLLVTTQGGASWTQQTLTTSNWGHGTSKVRHVKRTKRFWFVCLLLFFFAWNEVLQRSRDPQTSAYLWADPGWNIGPGRDWTVKSYFWYILQPTRSPRRNRWGWSTSSSWRSNTRSPGQTPRQTERNTTHQDFKVLKMSSTDNAEIVNAGKKKQKKKKKQTWSNDAAYPQFLVCKIKVSLKDTSAFTH